MSKVPDFERTIDLYKKWVLYPGTDPEYIINLIENLTDEDIENNKTLIENTLVNIKSYERCNKKKLLLLYVNALVERGFSLNEYNMYPLIKYLVLFGDCKKERYEFIVNHINAIYMLNAEYYSSTTFYKFIEQNDYHLVKLLLENNVDPNANYFDSTHPVFALAELINKKIDIDSLKQMIDILHEYNLDFTFKNRFNKSILDKIDNRQIKDYIYLLS